MSDLPSPTPRRVVRLYVYVTAAERNQLAFLAQVTGISASTLAQQFINDGMAKCFRQVSTKELSSDENR